MPRIARILIFIILLLLVYGGLNFYTLSKFALGLPTLPGWALASWGAAMLLAPFIIRFFRHHHWLRAEAAYSWVAFVWMGLLFMFSCLALAFDAAHVLTGFTSFDWPLTAAIELACAGGAALLLAAYGFYEASRIRVDHLRIRTAKFSGKRITLAQVSDIHLGAMLGGKFLDRVTGKLRELEPDVLIATGDIVDGKGEALHALTEHFRLLAPPLGAYAILGNHEYFAGLDNSLTFFRNAHFTVLRGEVAEVGGIVIAGVDDRSLGAQAQQMPEATCARLAAAREQQYIILLKHQPLVDDEVPFDLQLSGHLHGGQIFPFGFFSRLFYGVRAGSVHLSGGRLLYINRGTGTWGPPMRLFAPPEITLVTIEGEA